MTFGQRLKQLRVDKGLSRYELSVEIKTHEANIMAWENGRREPRMDAIRRMAAALGTTTDALMLDGGE